VAKDEHPFGFGGERYFWAFIVALVIFTAGSMFALFEGVEKLSLPHQLESVGWARAILRLERDPPFGTGAMNRVGKVRRGGQTRRSFLPHFDNWRAWRGVD